MTAEQNEQQSTSAQDARELSALGRFATHVQHAADDVDLDEHLKLVAKEVGRCADRTRC